MRPVVSFPGYGPHYENEGFIIAGKRHKLACRCYACQAVRRRGREKRIRLAMINQTFDCQ